MQKHLFLGTISGTSVDGLDIALLAVEGRNENSQISILQADTIEFPDSLASELRALANPSQGELDRLGYADATLGEFIGQTCRQFLTTHSLHPGAITAIGSHGQTVRHRPGKAGENRFSLQIGDPNRIAEISGITTIADFRRRDIAAGGQGAPLVPPFHKALFANTDHAVVLNIGGISNVSILSDTPSGYDTGPGNCLMDEWCQQHGHGSYDADGRWAASGTVIADLLQCLLSDPYFSTPTPKSTGREYFHAQWLAAHEPEKFAPEDVQATLCELTARCTIDALVRSAPHLGEIIVCGGGRLNSNLLKRLRDSSGWDVRSCDDLGIDGDAIEAAAFAWFAHQTINAQPSNEPAVTGATGYRVLGAIYPG
ncbi:MAG: anhydro-N-acetylmuramic acid kinase [Pseudomonadales bacterium]|jgi:anhydro-N-acetylmuramic acid kinase|nr:anhydro-N-acetylmuramic acid kinase [Pseudomonadales bacterium]